MRKEHQEVKILIVDDDEDDYFIIGDYIRHIPGGAFRIDWCYRYEEALHHMVRGDYQLYFVDYRMGARSGMDLLKEALEQNCLDPVILLTGQGNYKVDIEAMKMGATDYLVKTDLTVEKLERCIRYALERSASVKALKVNERRYRSIFEKSRDLVFLADPELNFRDTNEVARQLLGYTRDEMNELSLWKLMDSPLLEQEMRRQLEYAGGIDDREVVLHTRSGDRRNCIVSVSLEKDDNDMDYVQGIIHDITNLKKAEKAALHAEKLAATGRLVRTLAHEVRNPLNNITLSVEQLQLQEMEDDQIACYIDIIRRNSKRIGDLISELLNTSQPSHISLREHVLQEIMDDVIGAAVDRITLKRIGLKLSYPEDRIRIQADREKLRMALLNIIINAVEAMEEDTGMLQVSVLPEAGEKVQLLIKDNGCGISEENISRMFEPYFTHKRNGMGLGLAVTLNILQAHKAGIEVVSAPGKGALFTVSFHLADHFPKDPDMIYEELGRPV